MASTTANQTPGSARLDPSVLCKSPNLTLQYPESAISRRHSWISTSFPSKDSDMASTTATMAISESTHESAGGSSPTLPFLTARPGATFDMACFLRNTGPPGPCMTQRDEEARKSSRKRNRGFFKKWREIPEVVTTAAEEPNAAVSVYVPPEGVEQKTTARGNKYLQIVTHPGLLDLGQIMLPKLPAQHARSRGFSSPHSDHTDVIASDDLDTWIQSLGLEDKGADLSVKTPITPENRPIDVSSSFGAPRTPQSFVSEANLWLPSAESGFGLSIVDGQNLEPYSGGGSASNGSEALFSHPPSHPSTPVEPSRIQRGSAETAELPLLEKRIDSARGDTPSPNHGEKFEQKEKFDRRSTEVLAGQGLRRPFRDGQENVDSPTRASQELFPSAAIQNHRNREAAVRAKKIKALQQARRTIDEIVKERLNQKGASPAVHELVDAFEEHTLPRTHEERPTSSQNSGKVHLSQVMLVAEQIPVPRGRQAKKPARLVLRDKSISQHNKAVRTDRSASVEYNLNTVTPHRNESQRERANTPPELPPAAPSKSSSRNTPTTSFFTPHSTASAHISSPLTATSLTPQAVTATATITGGLRTSVCSSHTSNNKEARLQARVEALERENRLLEAALMAVLKTSGTLNRCPCVVLKERSDNHNACMGNHTPRKPAALSPSASRSGTPCPSGKGTTSELKRVTEEAGEKLAVSSTGIPSSASSTHTRKGSMESTGSGISALEVYLRTKIGH